MTDDIKGLDVIEKVELNGLYSTEKASVQPNVLLRTAVFSPVGKTRYGDQAVKDLSTSLRKLEICQKEGYEHVTISGPCLNVETDFRVWCGIVLTFFKYDLSFETIKLPFTEFAGLCGYPSRRFSTKLRDQIYASLTRIKLQGVSFKSRDGNRVLTTGLLSSFQFDIDKDIIELRADERLWDLYQIDHQVLVSMQVLSKLPKAEVAQCLYLYFLSLPPDPHPVSFRRLRERLQLDTPTKEANRRIKLGIEKLEKIGFISGIYVKRGAETYYMIDSRNSKLLLGSDVLGI